MRGTLCQILKDQIPDVEIIFGDSIKSISQSSDSVQVEFKNNPSRKFDLVIGADGLHSNVRKLVFGNEKQFSNEFGIYLCVYTVPNYLNIDRMEIQYTELGRMAQIWSTRGDKDARVCFAFTTQQPVEPRNIEVQQQMVRTIFQELQWEFPKFLELMKDAPDFYFDIAAQIQMSRWSAGRVILLGDAAYCPTPMSGQGTSLALVGAYILAGELALAKGDYKIAFNQFEQEIRPYININQELGLQSANLFKSQEKKNPLTWLIGKLLSFAPGRLIEFFINRATARIHKAANSITLKNYDGITGMNNHPG
jgi:2-polyprenyl-6-methoxyphenol hydroxylase-like FAD-dependent oxidoreductase